MLKQRIWYTTPSNLSVFEQTESFLSDFMGKTNRINKKIAGNSVCFCQKVAGWCTCQTQQKSKKIFINIPSCEELEEVGRTVIGSKGHSVLSIVSSLETAKEEAVCVEERWFPCAWNTMAGGKVPLTVRQTTNGRVCAVRFCAVRLRRDAARSEGKR